MLRKKILIIIPCFNEGKSIEILLKKVSSVLNTLDVKGSILVLDDGSEDDTVKNASAHAQVVSFPFNMGVGPVIHWGLQYAYDHQFDLCVRLDGDGQHDPTEIRKLVDKYNESGANLIVGSRFIEKKGYQSTFPRRTGIFLIQFFLYILFGKKLTDPTSGFHLFDKKAMSLFYQNFPYDFPEPTLLAWGCINKLVINEVPVNMKNREYGKSSITGIKSVAYIIQEIINLFFLYIGKWYD